MQWMLCIMPWAAGVFWILLVPFVIQIIQKWWVFGVAKTSDVCFSHGHSIPRHFGSPMHAFWHSWLDKIVDLLRQNHLYGFHLFVDWSYGWQEAHQKFADKLQEYYLVTFCDYIDLQLDICRELTYFGREHACSREVGWWLTMNKYPRFLVFLVLTSLYPFCRSKQVQKSTVFFHLLEVHQASQN